jgi:hypothetical protein
VPSDQHTQRVHGRGELAPQQGDERLRAGQVELGLAHVEVRADPGIAAVDREPQGSALRLDVAEGVADTGLQRADLRVGVGHLRVERHEHVAVVFDRSLEARVRRLDRARDAPPEVELPEGVRSDAVEGVGPALPRGDVHDHLLALPVPLNGPDRVRLREAVAHGDAPLRARLQDASHGLA